MGHNFLLMCECFQDVKSYTNLCYNIYIFMVKYTLPKHFNQNQTL